MLVAAAQSVRLTEAAGGVGSSIVTAIVNAGCACHWFQWFGVSACVRGRGVFGRCWLELAPHSLSRLCSECSTECCELTRALQTVQGMGLAAGRVGV